MTRAAALTKQMPQTGTLGCARALFATRRVHAISLQGNPLSLANGYPWASSSEDSTAPGEDDV